MEAFTPGTVEFVNVFGTTEADADAGREVDADDAEPEPDPDEEPDEDPDEEPDEEDEDDASVDVAGAAVDVGVSELVVV